MVLAVAADLVHRIDRPCRERIRLMRDRMRERNVHRWAGQMLQSASRLRKRQRIHRLIAADRRGVAANA
jgi:trehalose 6-phosphate synthase